MTARSTELGPFELSTGQLSSIVPSSMVVNPKSLGHLPRRLMRWWRATTRPRRNRAAVEWILGLLLVACTLVTIAAAGIVWISSMTQDGALPGWPQHSRWARLRWRFLARVSLDLPTA